MQPPHLFQHTTGNLASSSLQAVRTLAGEKKKKKKRKKKRRKKKKEKKKPSFAKSSMGKIKGGRKLFFKNRNRCRGSSPAGSSCQTRSFSHAAGKGGHCVFWSRSGGEVELLHFQAVLGLFYKYICTIVCFRLHMCMYAPYCPNPARFAVVFFTSTFLGPNISHNKI